MKYTADTRVTDLRDAVRIREVHGLRASDVLKAAAKQARIVEETESGVVLGISLEYDGDYDAWRAWLFHSSGVHG